MTIQPDGKIIVSGTVITNPLVISSLEYFALARYISQNSTEIFNNY